MSFSLKITTKSLTLSKSVNNIILTLCALMTRILSLLSSLSKNQTLKNVLTLTPCRNSRIKFGTITALPSITSRILVKGKLLSEKLSILTGAKTLTRGVSPKEMKTENLTRLGIFGIITPLSLNASLLKTVNFLLFALLILKILHGGTEKIMILNISHTP